MIDLSHEIKEVELILTALRKMPMEIAEDLVMKIRGQAIPQIQAAKVAAAAPAAPVATQDAPTSGNVATTTDNSTPQA